MLTNSRFLFSMTRMRISCPQCKASYEVGTVIRNAVLVCHRCHTEFSMDQSQPETKEKEAVRDSEKSLPLFESVSQRKATADSPQQPEPVTPAATEDDVPSFLAGEHEYAALIRREAMPFPQPPVKGESGRLRPPITEKPEIQEPDTSSAPDNTPHIQLRAEDEVGVAPTAPYRSNVEIWPWLIVMLLVIGSVGFWYKKDAWLDDPWFRSVLINLHLPVEVRDRDWFIIPSSVQGHWLERDDGSQVLIIEGRIENLLYCDLAPPKILVRFFDDTGITESLGEKLMAITEPPSMEQIRHAPFKLPDSDKIDIESQGQRGFFLVVENLPERTADFTLSPVAPK